jgi:hypothetical protein
MLPYREALREFQRLYWSQAILEAGSLAGAARAAGIYRTDLHRRLHILKMPNPLPVYRKRGSQGSRRPWNRKQSSASKNI